MNYINTQTGEYPVTPAQMRARHPQTIFPQGYADAFGEYAPVPFGTAPAFDAATHRAVETQPVEQGGQWQQQWEVVPLTTQEIEAARLARVPQSCSRRQGRLALLAHGHLDDVETLIDAIADPAERRAAQIEYEADTWERGNPTVQAMWMALGGTPEQLDDLFVMAVTL